MKKIIIIIIFIWFLWGFYTINELNYRKHRQIQEVIVNHPEYLPNKEFAGNTSIGFKNLIADLYWLSTIQYIGGNAVSGEYKKYLFSMLDLITELNPYFETPYTIGQLLLPSYDDRYETAGFLAHQENIAQAIAISEKGIKNFCDTDKIDTILKQDDLLSLWSNSDLQNPCKSYVIPYYLAYIYFFYLNDGEQASDYYKISAMQDDAPKGAKLLAAIMQGKGGNREKSLFMFLGLAKSVNSDDLACLQLTQEIENVYTSIISQNLEIPSVLIRDIETFRDQVLPKLTRENEDIILDDTSCSNYLIKAIREINLIYIEQANEKFKADHPNNLPARNAKSLLNDGYIDFLPTDYQNYEGEPYGIIYEYNYELQRFDYINGIYY